VSVRQVPAPSNRPLATPEELAEFLNDIPVKTLAQWRYRGIGPKYRKIGRHVRYDWADIHSWLAGQCHDRRWAS
jgi:hypothetical protein